MAVLKVLSFPDKRLRTKAKSVESVDDSVRAIMDDMLETMYDAPGIGLAATQVDIHQQIVVIDISEEKDSPLYLVNPEITAKSGKEISEEGCLSVPEYYAEVERAETVTVSALGHDGKPFELEAEAKKSPKMLQFELQNRSNIYRIESGFDPLADPIFKYVGSPKTLKT